MQSLIELPDECVISILSWLPLTGLLACTTVSRDLYRLAKDPCLWKGLIVEIRPSDSHKVPESRLWCSSVVFNGKLYIYGGHITNADHSNLISQVKTDFHFFDFENREWNNIIHTMGGKTEHKCVVYDNSLWFVGGYNGSDYTNDITKYNPITNEVVNIEVTGDTFSRRSALTAVVYNNKLYVFGGWNGFSKIWFNDLYEFDFAKRHWRIIKTNGISPKNRTSHSSVIFNNKMYVFGGFSGEEYLNDLHQFDFETETWTNISLQCKGNIPSPRSRFCACVYGENMYILGGWNKINYFNDFYSFNFNNFTWTQIQNSNFRIPTISQYSLSVNDNFMYIFGGFCGEQKICSNKLFTCQLSFPSQSQ